MVELGRVLAVDDNAMNLRILRRILERDFEVETADNGEACLQRIGSFRPHVVLLDVMMPGLSGFDTCRRIKSDLAGDFTQVILVSAKSSTVARLQGYECQADGYYLAKPFNHDELLSKVRVQFRLWEMHRELKEAKRQLQAQNQNLESIVLERTRQVVAVHSVTTFALAQLAELRDSETGNHLHRIRVYSHILADELRRQGSFGDRIDIRFVEDIFESAPLHDVGKVGIPDHVLLKPGKLTPEEFDVMKRHVLIGGETLRQSCGLAGGGFLSMAADIAMYHHERFDGSGYVFGLRGEEIPLAARIVAVADVFDAMSTARVYKPAFDATQVWNEIVSGTGTQFDPRVVEAFRSRYADLQAVQSTHLMSSQEANSGEVGKALHPAAIEPMMDASDLERGAIRTVLSLNDRLREDLVAAEHSLRRQAWEIKVRASEARTDPLTQLPNRRAFDEELQRRFADFRNLGRPFSLMVADTDYFKRLNDVYGHHGGDCVLTKLATLLRESLQGLDFVARFGGDEFVFILPGSDLGAARLTAERVRMAVENEPFRLGADTIWITLSIGVTQVASGDDAAALFARADQALYASKRDGRNSISSHSAEIASCTALTLVAGQ